MTLDIFDPMKPRTYASDYITISPSAASKFNSNTFECIKNLVCKEITFKGNTSTLLGSCVHRVAEVYYQLNGNEKATREHVMKEIPNYIHSLQVPDDIEIDKNFILEQFKPMAEMMLKYLKTYGIPDESEITLSMDLGDNILLKGTYDARQGSTLIDYKTTSTKNPQPKIPEHYKLQMMLYVLLLKQKGIHISNLRIVWITTQEVNRISEKTGKPMKDYPSQFVIANEKVLDEDLIETEEFLKSMKNTLVLFSQNSALAQAFSAHFDLKEKIQSRVKTGAELPPSKKDKTEELCSQLFE